MAELDLGRVKRNVGKMLTQGAPEEEIDAYIADEGTTIDAVKAFKAPPANQSLGDQVKEAATGFGYGANIGMDAILNAMAAPVRVPINMASSALGYGDVIPELEAARKFNTVEPKTELGRVSQAVGEVAGGSVVPYGVAVKTGQVMGKAAPKITLRCFHQPGHQIFRHSADRSILIDFGVD